MLRSQPIVEFTRLLLRFVVHVGRKLSLCVEGFLPRHLSVYFRRPLGHTNEDNNFCLIEGVPGGMPVRKNQLSLSEASGHWSFGATASGPWQGMPALLEERFS